MLPGCSSRLPRVLEIPYAYLIGSKPGVLVLPRLLAPIFDTPLNYLGRYSCMKLVRGGREDLSGPKANLAPRFLV